MVAAMFIGCNNDHSPETSSTKLWPAAMVSTDAQGVQTAKWGYIDEKGNFAIATSYDEANEFSCGFACVRVSGGKLFFIDTKGNMQSAPDFLRVYTFFYYDHVTYITSSYLYGMLNKNFEIAIQPAYKYLGVMSDAGLVAYTQDGDKFGYLDKNGEIAISATYDFANTFDAGYAVVQMGTTYGIIDKGGNFTISLQDKRLGNLGGERIGFMDPTTYKFGMMDAKGHIIVQAMYDDYSTYGFTDVDLMAVGQDKKWGYMDKNGKVVIGVQFAYATPFLNGFAFIARTETSAWECIDEKGKTVFTLAKDEAPAGLFINGLCLVEKEETDGISYKYVNEKGATIYTWKYSGRVYAGGGNAGGGGELGGDEDYAPARRAVNASHRLDVDKLMEGTPYGYRGMKK